MRSESRFANRERPNRGLLAGALALIAVACSGAGDRPPVGGQVGTVVPPSAAADPPDGDGSGTTTAAPTDSARACEPRTKRECQVTYRIADGTILDCGMSVEWCREDGSGWLPCGRTAHGPNGEDRPPY